MNLKGLTLQQQRIVGTAIIVAGIIVGIYAYISFQTATFKAQTTGIIASAITLMFIIYGLYILAKKVDS